MVATAPAQERLKFHSPDTNRFAYKVWDEMSVTEQAYVRTKYPAYAAEYEGAGEAGRYAAEIGYYEDRIAALKEIERTRMGVERGQARGAIRQYQQGIEILREAESIPEDTRAWFVVMPGELKAIVPPRFNMNSSEQGVEDRRIYSVDHVVDLSDPVRIAYMRRMVAAGGTDALTVVEQTVGTYPLLDLDTGERLAWGPREDLDRGRAAKRYR